MKKLLWVLVMLSVVPSAYPCSMVYPAYGVYSGGTILMGTYLNGNFAWIMASVIVFKALSYMYMGTGPKLHLFGAMIVGNLVTTIIGYVLEASHLSLIDTLLISSAPAAIVLHFAGKNIWRLEYHPRIPKITLNGLTGVLWILFIGIGVLSVVITGTQKLGLWHWVLKWVFCYASLIITLFVPTSYEYAVICRINKDDGRHVFVPVLKANLLVFFLLFGAIAVILLSRNKLPVL